MTEVYTTPGIECQGIDINKLRSMLPSTIGGARSILEKLDNYLELESQTMSEIVTIDVSEGTYVRAVEFVDSSEVKFIFNEGTEDVLDQRTGLYQIGEKVFKLNNSVVNTHDLSVHTQERACKKLIQYNDDYSLVPNKTFLDLLYAEFPRVRKAFPDELYNLFDVNFMCSRIEVFRSYVTSGLFLLISKIPDLPNITLATIMFSKMSVKYVEDMLSRINGKRENPLSLVHLDSDLIQTQGHVVYLSDVWVNPARFDHNVVAAPHKNASIDLNFLEALDDYSKYVSDSSNLILGSYYPVLDIYKDDSSLYSSKLFDYSYSQFSYVPHKPWTLLNIGLQGDVHLSNLIDSPNTSVSVRFSSRIDHLLKSCYVNLHRNYLLANSKCRKEMYITAKLIPSLSTLFYNKEKWYHYLVMHRPVLLKSSILSYKPNTPVHSVELVILMSNLKEKIQYSRNELSSLGWNDFLLSRALNLGLLNVWKSGVLYRYEKYKRVNQDFSSYFYKEKPTHSQVTVVLPDGSVVANKDSSFDSAVAVYPQLDFTIYNDKDFSANAPYDIELQANSEKLYGSSGRYNFTRTNNEFNVGYVSSKFGVDVNKGVNKKKRNRYVKKRNKDSTRGKKNSSNYPSVKSSARDRSNNNNNNRARGKRSKRGKYKKRNVRPQNFRKRDENADLIVQGEDSPINSFELQDIKVPDNVISHIDLKSDLGLDWASFGEDDPDLSGDNYSFPEWTPVLGIHSTDD